ncbi:S1 family peptidase [Actinokineospora sp. UTMC 2448]|uniref:S1 family peptidase n=1 Tax=Actinokineospora sp. UTMC 2448 TaxID=2268449 RepID=UPI0021645600|nr:S1 family peptidase [Actinokineospora sp. UTMC 2448]UVS78898.1 Alpha-lytic protease precursor [Actinokineospora sp. UTMC 2448]
MKRSLTAAAVLAAAATAIATPGAATAVPEVAPELLAAMQRDLGMTADAALERLAAEADAAGAEQRLAAALPDAFGGAWFDASRNVLVVGVTDAARADAVRADGAVPQVVRHSARELDAVVDRLDAAKAPAGVTGWYVDVQRNTVTITTATGTAKAAEAFAARAGVADTTTVVESAEAPRPLYDVRGGDAYYPGNSRCSIGFSVQGGFVTAGHCGRVGTSTSGYNRVAQGTVRGSSFPGDDMGWVQVNSSWTPTGVVNRYNGGTVSVSGSSEAPVGASVCRSGSTTGWRCGTIQAKNQTVRYSQGAVYGLTRTSACAEGGDSGGSWLSGNQAQGVTSGGSGNCSWGGTTYFQPVNEILNRYGLRLITS